jgi:hypothetical protein
MSVSVRSSTLPEQRNAPSLSYKETHCARNPNLTVESRGNNRRVGSAEIPHAASAYTRIALRLPTIPICCTWAPIWAPIRCSTRCTRTRAFSPFRRSQDRWCRRRSAAPTPTSAKGMQLPRRLAPERLSSRWPRGGCLRHMCCEDLIAPGRRAQSHAQDRSNQIAPAWP